MLLLLRAARAATLVVDPSDGSAYATIQAAIDAAADGDVVSVASGTYLECLDFGGRDLDLVGASGSAGTTVDATALCDGTSAVRAVLGEAVGVQGITFLNASSRVFEVVGGSLSLDDVVVRDVDLGTTASGAAIYAEDASVDVRDATFSGLRASSGGAVYALDSTVVLSGVDVNDTYAAYAGGAVWFSTGGDDVLSLADCVIEAASTGISDGGGLYVEQVDPGDASDASLLVASTTFRALSADDDGGAIAAFGVDVLAITDCTFEDDDAANGGAILVDGSDDVAVSGSTFCGNRARTGSGGAARLTDVVAQAWTRSVFSGNRADAGSAGALHVSAGSSVSVLEDTFVGNAGDDVGEAGTLYFADSVVDVRNSLVAWTASGPAIWVDDGTTVATVAYDAFYANVDGDAGRYATFSTGADGNVAGDPLLVAYSDDGECGDDDLRLSLLSPLVDAGDPARLDDDGSPSDIGAFPGATAVDADGDGVDQSVDCDDHDAGVHPGAAETCDGRDEDCDGDVDEDAVDPLPWYQDADDDGYGTPEVFLDACAAPDGFVSLGGDCADDDAFVHPEAPEQCDEIDQDCDGAVDEDAIDARTWYPDEDLDGYGAEGAAVLSCLPPDGFIALGGDCDDGADAVHPDQEERCNGYDDDCDGQADGPDAVDATLWYADGDGDGYGAVSAGLASCVQPDGFVATAGDCDDDASDIWPGAVEVCDGRDNDCDKVVDDEGAEGSSIFYADVDHDGYGDADVTATRCTGGLGWSSDATDCNDGVASIHPGAVDAPYDGIDQDCDGADLVDADGDGYVGTEAGGDDCVDDDPDAYPGATDVWYDGVDGNCDGADDYDQDADGFRAEAWDGDDCDDLDPGRNPGVEETWYDGVDADCAGDDDYDQDGDAHRTEAYGGDDCDDTVAEAYPGAPDAWYDGVDGDCAGDDDYDQDGDGHASDAYGGDDCADTDAHVHPDLSDDDVDGVDRDCDGADGHPAAETDGCGCASPGGTAGGGAGVLLGLGVLLARRRR